MSQTRSQRRAHKEHLKAEDTKGSHLSDHDNPASYSDNSASVSKFKETLIRDNSSQHDTTVLKLTPSLPKVENNLEDSSSLLEKTATKLTAKPKKAEQQQQHMCEVCGMYLGSAGSLRRHRLFLHETDIEGNPFRCPQAGCRRVFSTEQRRERHVRSEHMGEKPHICQRCGKSFGLRHYLTDHLLRCQQLHYRCDRCHDRFTNRAALNDHRRTVHEGKVFSCTCGKVFKSSSGLRRHSRKCVFGAISMEDF